MNYNTRPVLQSFIASVQTVTVKTASYITNQKVHISPCHQTLPCKPQNPNHAPQDGQTPLIQAPPPLCCQTFYRRSPTAQEAALPKPADPIQQRWSSSSRAQARPASSSALSHFGRSFPTRAWSSFNWTYRFCSRRARPCPDCPRLAQPTGPRFTRSDPQIFDQISEQYHFHVLDKVLARVPHQDLWIRRVSSVWRMHSQDWQGLELLQTWVARTLGLTEYQRVREDQEIIPKAAANFQ